MTISSSVHSGVPRRYASPKAAGAAVQPLIDVAVGLGDVLKVKWQCGDDSSPVRPSG